jgi:YbgC/YbaW family acyl-CoA thioester hydrolase
MSPHQSYSSHLSHLSHLSNAPRPRPRSPSRDGQIVHNAPGILSNVTDAGHTPSRDFRFWIDQDVRFRDLDTLKHVNHTVYFIYAEMARLEYYRKVLELDLMTELAFLMLDIRCHYRVAAEFGDTLRVGFRMDWLKRSSSGFSFVILGPDERLFAEVMAYRCSSISTPDGRRRYPKRCVQRCCRSIAV